MDDRGLDLERAMLLEQLGRFKEAGQVLLNEGRLLQAIALFLKEPLGAAERVVQCLLDAFWQRLSFGISPSSQVARSDGVLIELTHILNSPETKAYNLNAHTHDEVCLVTSRATS